MKIYKLISNIIGLDLEQESNASGVLKTLGGIAMAGAGAIGGIYLA